MDAHLGFKVVVVLFVVALALSVAKDYGWLQWAKSSIVDDGEPRAEPRAEAEPPKEMTGLFQQHMTPTTYTQVNKDQASTETQSHINNLRFWSGQTTPGQPSPGQVQQPSERVQQMGRHGGNELPGDTL
jgi:hypothetical protein